MKTDDEQWDSIRESCIAGEIPTKEDRRFVMRGHKEVWGGVEKYIEEKDFLELEREDIDGDILINIEAIKKKVYSSLNYKVKEIKTTCFLCEYDEIVDDGRCNGCLCMSGMGGCEPGGFYDSACSAKTKYSLLYYVRRIKNVEPDIAEELYTIGD